MTSELAVDTVRLDAETRNHFLTLKRRTGIENWNVLARWAFCTSIQDDAPLRQRQEKGLGAIEMTWRTFGGEAEGVYMALLRARCEVGGDALTRDSLSESLRGHIARGAARLVGKRQMKTISEFIATVQSDNLVRPKTNRG
jgi:DNA sulfur modification protein DndE